MVHTLSSKVKHSLRPDVPVAVRQLEDFVWEGSCLPGLCEQMRLLLLGLQR